MLFKNPTVLYGLLFLLVPIIVHLFQLRRFKKVAFTNVAFLQPLVTQSRKSRTLKKWLALLARLLAIACLVLAFAQPYFATGNTATNENLVIYLDNSYSMQAKGAEGILYQTAINQLIEKLPADLKFTIFTNDQVFKNVTRQEIANDLLTAGFSTTALSADQISLKAQSLTEKGASAKLVWISDFQRHKDQSFTDQDSTLNKELIQMTAVELLNVSLDSAFLTIDEDNETYIEASISSNISTDQPVTVSLYNDDILLAKTTAALTENGGSASFQIPQNLELDGYLLLEDEGLAFDNKLYLSTNKKEKIKILHVNDSPSDFLSKIFTADEFEYQTVTSSQLNYNSIKDQQVVILNEAPSIPTSLASELNAFARAGNTLVVIPALVGQGYSSISGISDVTKTAVEKRITTINFEHPLLNNVFSKRVTNFQYPYVKNTAFAKAGTNKILSYDDGSAFLFQNGNTYVFTAPLNEENSNFQNFPLVVPVFYKLGLRTAASMALYGELGTNNQVNVPVRLEVDQVLQLQNADQQFIPEQRAFDAYVELQTGSEIDQPGTYAVLKADESVAKISFNISREENQLDYYSDEELGQKPMESVTAFIRDFQEDRNALELWKYFIAAALFFLICEMLILKLIK